MSFVQPISILPGRFPVVATAQRSFLLSSLDEIRRRKVLPTSGPTFAGFTAEDVSHYFGGYGGPAAGQAIINAALGLKLSREQMQLLSRVYSKQSLRTIIPQGLQHLSEHPKGSHYHGDLGSVFSDIGRGLTGLFTLGASEIPVGGGKRLGQVTGAEPVVSTIVSGGSIPTGTLAPEEKTAFQVVGIGGSIVAGGAGAYSAFFSTAATEASAEAGAVTVSEGLRPVGETTLGELAYQAPFESSTSYYTSDSAMVFSQEGEVADQAISHAAIPTVEQVYGAPQLENASILGKEAYSEPGGEFFGPPEQSIASKAGGAFTTAKGLALPVLATTTLATTVYSFLSKVTGGILPELKTVEGIPVGIGSGNPPPGTSFQFGQGGGTSAGGGVGRDLQPIIVPGGGSRAQIALLLGLTAIVAFLLWKGR